MRAVIFGCSGPKLLARERDFFRSADPWGFILFARNVETPEQLCALTQALRECIARPDAPIFIDQEGGRVARLKPPYWRAAPAAGLFGQIYAHDRVAAREACHLNARLLADELHALGISADCAPVLDVPVAGSHNIIGDRAFARDPQTVAILGRAMCEGLLEGGILPVIKHIPGHGRGAADSHLELPQVAAPHSELADTDFVPFGALADMPLAMTGHIAYGDIAGHTPATHSRRIVADIIRDEIGFDGALMSDDLGMAALPGSFVERTQKTIDAGCDLVLHCSGVEQEMTEIMGAVPELAGRSAQRCVAALARRGRPLAFDAAAATARLDALIAPYLGA